MKISDYANPSKGGLKVQEDDIYPATIVAFRINMDGPEPKVNEWGKHSGLLVLHLSDRDENGDPVELTRNINISYGSAGGVYGPLATLIEAALGIKCGDRRQRNVTTEDLEGKRIRVQTKNAEGRNGGTFTNIVNFLPPKKTKPALEPVLDDLDDDLPF